MQPQTKAHLLLELLIVGGWCAKQLSPDINSDNKLIEALLNEAIGLREAGKAQLSLQLIDQAMALELSSPWFADNRARALLALEQRQEALAIWLQLSREADPLVAEMAVAMLMENADSTSRRRPRTTRRVERTSRRPTSRPSSQNRRRSSRSVRCGPRGRSSCL